MIPPMKPYRSLLTLLLVLSMIPAVAQNSRKIESNLVKVVTADNGDALYFSRSIIPYIRGEKWQEWLESHKFHTHVGIYAYRSDALGEITTLQRSRLEIAESLEQLRWLENGYKIRTALTGEPTIGIDSPADLEAAERWLASQREEKGK